MEQRRIHKVSRHNSQADYKTNCLDGVPHPLECPTFAYKLVTLGWRESEPLFSVNQSLRLSKGEWSAADMEMIESFVKRPEIEWALDNSLDGLYVSVEHNAPRITKNYKFSAYLKEEHITWWKLKFS